MLGTTIVNYGVYGPVWGLLHYLYTLRVKEKNKYELYDVILKSICVMTAVIGIVHN